MGRDHAIECDRHPGTFYSGFNGPDECPLCEPQQDDSPAPKISDELHNAGQTVAVDDVARLADQEQAVERVARALYEARIGKAWLYVEAVDRAHPSRHVAVRERYRKQARIAIAAYHGTEPEEER